MKQKASHPFSKSIADDVRLAARADNQARLQSEQRIFDEMMTGPSERGRNDNRSRYGDYAGVRQHEDWLLGFQLEHGIAVQVAS